MAMTVPRPIRDDHIPPERGARQWRHLRQHPAKGLEARSRASSPAPGKPVCRPCFIHVVEGKTIKSLLMTPNPESALNEAAGKMLLEDYDGFRSHAALLTRIHASGPAKVENSCGLEKPMSCKSESATLGKNPPPSAVNSLNEARKKLRRL